MRIASLSQRVASRVITPPCAEALHAADVDDRALQVFAVLNACLPLPQELACAKEERDATLTRLFHGIFKCFVIHEVIFTICCNSNRGFH